MSPTKPVVLFVHGAYHPPICYEDLTSKLEAAGYELITPRLALLGAEAANVRLEDDVARVVQAAEPHLDAGRDIVLVAHSYGGTVGCHAVKGRTTKERGSEGKAGGFRAVVYICSTLAAKGRTIFDTSNPNLMEALTVEEQNGHTIASINPGPGSKAREFYLNGVPDDQVAKAFSHLEPVNPAPFYQEMTVDPADILIPQTYISCAQDNVVLFENQKRLLLQFPMLKDVRLTESGHSPWLTELDRVFNTVVDVASK